MDTEEVSLLSPDLIGGPELPADPPVHQSHRKAMYRFCRLTCRYVFDGITAALPIAAPEDPSSNGDPNWEPSEGDATIVFDLCRQQCRRIIHYDAERVGKWPSLPEPLRQYEDGSLVGRLLNRWEKQFAPMLAEDGQLVLRIEAYYIYAMNRAPTKDEATRVGVLPFSDLDQDNVAITRAEVYEDRLAVGVRPT